MRVAGLTAAGDWRFGKGRAVYLRRSEAIRQSVVTRLRSFVDDWFADIDAGLPWIEMLGTRNNETRILREIERTVLQTEGVRSIQRLRLTGIDQDRGATIELSIVDIFDQRLDETVSVIP
jgi:hypothetical protein